MTLKTCKKTFVHNLNKKGTSETTKQKVILLSSGSDLMYYDERIQSAVWVINFSDRICCYLNTSAEVQFI